MADPTFLGRASWWLDMVGLFSPWQNESQRRDQAQDVPTGSLSDLLPTARSYLLKLPESPREVPQAGIPSLSTRAHWGSFHVPTIPEVLYF